MEKIIELRKPTHYLVEDYLFDVFSEANNKLNESDRFKIFVGKQSGGSFIRFLEKEVNAIFNLYAVDIQTVGSVSTAKYQRDTVKFFIDIIVATNTRTNKLWDKEKITQDEAAHKALMVYCDLTRNILSDIAIRQFGLPQGVIGNFRFNSVSSFEVEYREEEVTMLAARIEFTLDMPYFAFDSKDYEELKEIFISIKNKNREEEILIKK